MRIILNEKREQPLLNVSAKTGAFMDKAGDIWTRKNVLQPWIILSARYGIGLSQAPNEVHGPYREVVISEIIAEERL